MTEGHRKACRWLISIASVILLVVFVIPPIVLTLALSRHVNYERVEAPLGGVQTGDQYGLKTVEQILRTEDGETIWCSEVPIENPKGVILYLSGITKPSVTHFYSHADWMREYGFASVLLEVRGHGNSSGRKLGLGYTEPADVRAALDYIQTCPEYLGLPVIIWGVSMGGAIAINSFGQFQEIDACIAMSPYASFEVEADLMMQQYGIPAPLRRVELCLLSYILDGLYGEENVDTLVPEKQIQHADGRPVFLIACTGDTTVPVENAEILSAAAPDADVWIRESQDHFVVKDNHVSAVSEDTEYCTRILEWMMEQGFVDA